jgi:hypothetical protein
MAKMSRSKVEEIVAKELPGYRVLPKPNDGIDSARVRRQPEASSPELDQLMRKFGIDGDHDIDFGYSPDAVPNGGAVDDEIELVERASPADPLSRGNRPKAKVISPEGRIKGSQG